MPSIRRVGTALPRHRYSKDEISEAGRRWLSSSPSEAELFCRYLASASIDYRHFALELDELLAQGGAKLRAERFASLGLPLARDAALRAIGESPVAAIGSLISVSCSVPLVPGIDCRLIDELELPRSIVRVPVYQYGCAGGVAGLSLASRLVEEGSDALVVSTELCSLVYQRDDLGKGNLVGSALFGDGAAAAQLTADRGVLPRILAAESCLLRESGHLMGYDILDDGTHLRLDRNLPLRLSVELPALLSSFLDRHSIAPGEVRWWLFHPGGTKILKNLETILAIEPERSRWSWEVLSRYGNMSSASILFVLERFLEDCELGSGDIALVLGIGPGLTVELMLLEC